MSEVGDVRRREGGEEFRGWHFLSLILRGIYFFVFVTVVTADPGPHIEDDKRCYNSFVGDG